MRVKELERVDVCDADARGVAVSPCPWGRYVRYTEHTALVAELLERLHRLQSTQNFYDIIGNGVPSSEVRPDPGTHARPTDEDVWREAFITMLPSYPWEKAVAQADGVLDAYRKRWPR